MLHFSTELPKKAEIVIIGGGVIGTMMAYFLAKDHHEVLLLERHDIGSGTTSAAAAAALLQTKTSARKLEIANKSLALLDLLYEELDHDFEYEHTGSLLAGNTPDEMALISEMNSNLQSLGLEVELVDSNQAHEIIPILGDTILGGSYSPRDAQINPIELIIACAKGAARYGAKIIPFIKVEDIKSKNGNIEAVVTNIGRIMTEIVINATGVWAPDIARMVNIDLPIQPLKGELLVTERMPKRMTGTLISAKYLLSKAKLERESNGSTPKRSVGITLVQVNHGNFIVGSTREPAGFDRSSTFGGIQELASQLLELVPSLANTRLLRSYAGLRPITPDGNPIIGRSPTLPGLIQSAGFGGDGLVMSAITAEMITSLLGNPQGHELLPMFSLTRFE